MDALTPAQDPPSRFFGSLDENTKMGAHRCFRARKYIRNVGITVMLFASTIGLASVFVAYFNVDGSFPRPLLAACQFGLLWSGFVLLGTYLFFFHQRYRLQLSDRSIQQRGVFTDRDVLLETTHQITWRRYPAGGSVKIQSAGETLKIDFANLESSDREVIISQIRNSVPDASQSGWERFGSQFQKPAKQSGSHQRARRWLILVLWFHAIVFVGFAAWGLGNQFLVTGLVNAVVALFFQRRNSPSRSKHTDSVADSLSQ